MRSSSTASFVRQCNTQSINTYRRVPTTLRLHSRLSDLAVRKQPRRHRPLQCTIRARADPEQAPETPRRALFDNDVGSRQRVSSRKTQNGAIQPCQDNPRSGFNFALENFVLEAKALLQQGLARPDLPEGVQDLKLSNAQILEDEESRPKVPTNPLTEFLYNALCRLLDAVYEDKPVQRFWFLEVVARSPYFSYVSVIHLFESLGWWRAAELRKLHFAEEWNEMHHLLIMESLGGNVAWVDRFMAYHSVIVYYWALVVLYIIKPELSYNFSHLLEYHAVDTYGAFLRVNEEALRRMPAPQIAVQYYKTGDLYLFDSFQTRASMDAPIELRRPPCDSLYDTFKNICDDEREHVKTMKSCEEWCRGGGSPTEMMNNFYGIDETMYNPQSVVGSEASPVSVRALRKQRLEWEGFAQEVNPAGGEMRLMRDPDPSGDVLDKEPQ